MDENGVIFLNADDPLLFEMKDKMDVKTFTYGTNPEADYRAEDIVYENGYNTYTYVHNNDRILVNLSMLGKHNILNSLAAMAVADHMGLDLMKAAKSFEDFHGMRQKTIKSEKGYTIIDDSYNASPDSMKASINVLCDMPCEGKRIAVLGDMLELGENSKEYHREIGRYIVGKPVDEVYVIGELSQCIMEEIKNSGSDKVKVYSFSDNEEAVMGLGMILQPSDLVLFKASNGMHFTELVEILRQS
jgi:UDP-N-acetylmuramoyl-tripeptide--D-alanyl-D-alanine ligase